MKPYTEPKIIYKNEKDWYVYYRYTLSSGKKKVFTERKNVNRIKDRRERKTAIEELRNSIATLLKGGWNPETKQKNNPDDNLNLEEFLNKVYESGKTVYKEMSLKSYSSIKNIFVAWLKLKGYNILYPQNFSQTMAKEYLNYITLEKGYSGRSHNNHINVLKRYFGRLETANPFKGIPKLPQDIGKNFAFTLEERLALKTKLFAENRPLYYFVQFMFYGLLRRTETIRIKIEDIDLINKSIIVHSGVGKKRRQISKTIPVAFERLIKKMNLDNYPKSFYVFSYDLLPGANPLAKADYITLIHKKDFLDKLNISSKKTLYSWKHAGTVEYWNVMINKDPYALMRQLGHSDLNMTMIYLKSLGLIQNEAIRNADIEF